MLAYVYIVECSDGSLYTGWTNSVEKRLAAHNLGRASKYTRVRTPVRIVYCEVLASKKLAMQREWQIKKMTRGQKKAICAAPPAL